MEQSPTNSHLPLGTIVAFALSEKNIPPGWLLCDGRPVPPQTYSKLSHLMKFTPNLSGLTLIGAGKSAYGNTYHLHESGGEEKHVLTVSEMPSHQHSLQNAHDGGGTEGNSANWDREHIASGADYTSNTGGNQPHNNMQPFYVVNYIIYAGG